MTIKIILEGKAIIIRNTEILERKELVLPSGTLNSYLGDCKSRMLHSYPGSCTPIH
jgi:hypothetical protein